MQPSKLHFLLLELGVVLQPIVANFFLRFYLFMIEEAETQAEGEAGSMQGAEGGTRSRDSRITP